MTMTAFKVAPIKPAISPDVLDKIDIRVGTIELVEDVEGSEKLVKLTVHFGDHHRSILVGMKHERKNPKEIEGKQALFVVNLEPKKMRGQVSKACYSISDTRMESHPYSQCPKSLYRTGHEPDD